MTDAINIVGSFSLLFSKEKVKVKKKGREKAAQFDIVQFSKDQVEYSIN